MKSVMNYFEEIMNIPRESGKEEKIAQYIIDYAKENGIEYYLGKYNTVFLRKNNNSNKTIILQAHSDMVCVSTENFDFDNNGISFYIDGDYYRAKNTSLGADDGIGVAIILAILQENENMPNIEVIITTQEETTMLGAMNFDYSLVTGHTLISLDGITEGDIEASSAGMCSITLRKKINYENTKIENEENIDNENIEKKNSTYKLTISGLLGGNSGDDIDKNRVNAIKLIVKMLKEVNATAITTIEAGTKDNVIPSSGSVVFETEEDITTIQNTIETVKNELNEDVKVELEITKKSNSIRESTSIIELLDELRSGLLETFKEDGFPLLSANIGRAAVEDGEATIKYSIRSADKEKEEQTIKEVEKVAVKYGFTFNIDAIKPFFPFKEKSEIRELLKQSYKDLYNKEATIKKVHACMEGGILENNISNLDICTIAPTIEHCHSTNENVSISSTHRVYEWLKETLKRFNGR